MLWPFSAILALLALTISTDFEHPQQSTTNPSDSIRFFDCFELLGAGDCVQSQPSLNLSISNRFFAGLRLISNSFGLLVHSRMPKIEKCRTYLVYPSNDARVFLVKSEPPKAILFPVNILQKFHLTIRIVVEKKTKSRSKSPSPSQRETDRQTDREKGERKTKWNQMNNAKGER